YSYVLNNPMSYSDPSGFFFDKLWKEIKKYWRVALAIVATIYLGPIAAQLWGPIIGGAATGFVAGGIATGSLKGALVGAATGAMFGAIGDYFKNTQGFSVGKVASHGVAGGISSELSGGKFGHGFASAGFTQLAGQMGLLPDIGAASAKERLDNAIAAAIVGGTASALSGGKFANGAVTGMFSRMLNDSVHAEPKEGQRNKLSSWYRRGEKYANKGDMVDSLGMEGKTVIVFGKRGLKDFFLGVEGPVTDFLNHEVVHEHAFAIQDGDIVYNRGFSSNGLFTETKIKFTGFGHNSYAFTDYYVLPSGVDVKALFNNVPGNWSNYVLGGPSVNNCQTYADSVRRQIEVTYGSKE
ncbi:MAG TPA: hypothetical protein DCG38_03910, partial [Eubacteriaceae bacterium]|nr:hypothetical protein [Eubacteriaceae bacterium]